MIFFRFFPFLTLLFVIHCMSDCPAMASGSETPRFGLWAGAGSGLLTANETAIPFRLNLGAEIFLGQQNQMAVGYLMTAPISNDPVSTSQGTESLFRSAHYFPVLRFHLFPGDFPGRGFSFKLAPGFSMQHAGFMMSSNQNTTGTSATFAALLSAEYLMELEKKIDLGLETAYEYFAAARGSTPLPRVLVWSVSGNLHFYLGSKE